MRQKRIRTWPLVLLGAAVGVLIAACTHGLTDVTEPLQSAAARPVVSHSDVTATAAAVPAAQGPALDLRKFRPLLAAPELQAVALAHQSGDDALAAELLQRVIGEGNERDPRRYYLLGRLWQMAERAEPAWNAYNEAVALGSEQEWALVDEALLNCARLSFALGKPDRALAELGAVKHESNAVIEARAHALQQSERLADAEVEWARLVARLPATGEAFHRAELAHAESLWSLAAASDHGDELKARAAQALARAQLGLPLKNPIYLRGEELKKAWQVRPGVQSVDVLLLGVEELIASQAFDEAREVAERIQLSAAEAQSAVGCQLRYLRGKILAGQRKWGEAADVLTPALAACAAYPELHVSMLFNAGKYAAADGRDSVAVRHYEELEAKYGSSSLADDARLRRAQSYRDMGVQARFVELLAQMPEVYPRGDMTLEGVLSLALDQMERHKWSEAAAVLERAAETVQKSDSARGHEYAGTERYFLARCLNELGEEQRALAEYETLIRQVPLSYYMLHAYSRLLEADKERARLSLNEATQQALLSPFTFPYRPEYDSSAFRRAMELLMVGEFSLGREALRGLNLDGQADDSLLWGIALLFDRGLDVHYSHQVARGRLTDWLAHYPEGDWQRPWEIGFPRPYFEIVERESQKSGVPAWLIYGVMREESTFVADIVSPAKAYGLMQVIEPTARGIGKKFNLPSSVVALKQPATNIAIGARVLAELNKRFNKNPLLAIPGYNAGPGRPGRWLSERPNIDFDLWVETIPIRETRRYTKRVLASRAAYAFLYDREQAEVALVLPKRLHLN